MLWLILLIPWAAVLVLSPLVFRRRPRLETYPTPPPEAAPLVSIIVPARNEAHDIGACLATLLASDYANREIIVVDDRSEDGTADIARALGRRSDVPFEVVEGQPLPPGWFGKPWACWQGFEHAHGELVLFTDADTRHEAELLGHSVGALARENAALLSVVAHQAMETFWERLILPHVFLVLSLRYWDFRRVNRAKSPRDVIANGQYILVRRAAYERVGGHEAVRGDVVEDLRLAQRFAAAGERVFMAHAEALLETRMYHDLRDIIEGWSKNLATGARHTVEPWLRPLAPWLIAAFLLAWWVAPPVLLIAAIFGAGGGALLGWAAVACAVSFAFWGHANVRSGVPATYAFLYPAGAIAVAALFVRSALRGERIVWKGREYGAEGGRE